jgi:hypothetical protein
VCVEELNDLYSSPNSIRVIKSRRNRWARHVARTVERRGVYRILVGKAEGKRPLWRPRRRWENIFKIDSYNVFLYSNNESQRDALFLKFI